MEIRKAFIDNFVEVISDRELTEEELKGLKVTCFRGVGKVYYYVFKNDYDVVMSKVTFWEVRGAMRKKFKKKGGEGG